VVCGRRAFVFVGCACTYCVDTLWRTVELAQGCVGLVRGSKADYFLWLVGFSGVLLRVPGPGRCVVSAMSSG